jgi:hypothetical protein
MFCTFPTPEHLTKVPKDSLGTCLSDSYLTRSLDLQFHTMLCLCGWQACGVPWRGRGEILNSTINCSLFFSECFWQMNILRSVQSFRGNTKVSQFEWKKDEWLKDSRLEEAWERHFTIGCENHLLFFFPLTSDPAQSDCCNSHLFSEHY